MTGVQVSTQRLLPAGAGEGLADRSSTLTRDGGSGGGFARRRIQAARLESGQPSYSRRGVGQILDTSLDILVDRFGACLGIAALCWLPFRLAQEAIQRSSLGTEAFFLSQMTDGISGLLTTSFICSIVGGELFGRHVSVTQALWRGAWRLPGIGVLTLMHTLAAPIACLCLVFPWFIEGWLFSVIPAVYVLESGKLVEPVRGASGSVIDPLVHWVVELASAIARGIRLVWGWESFGRWLGWFAVISLVAMPLTALPQSLQMPEVAEFLDRYLGLRDSLGRLFVTVLSSCFIGLGNALTAVAMTVYYFDQRVRREGLDLSLSLERLERPVAAESAG